MRGVSQLPEDLHKKITVPSVVTLDNFGHIFPPILSTITFFLGLDASTVVSIPNVTALHIDPLHIQLGNFLFW